MKYILNFKQFNEQAYSQYNRTPLENGNSIVMGKIPVKHVNRIIDLPLNDPKSHNSIDTQKRLDHAKKDPLGEYKDHEDFSKKLTTIEDIKQGHCVLTAGEPANSLNADFKAAKSLSPELFELEN